MAVDLITARGVAGAPAWLLTAEEYQIMIPDDDNANEMAYGLNCAGSARCGTPGLRDARV